MNDNSDEFWGDEANWSSSPARDCTSATQAQGDQDSSGSSGSVSRWVTSLLTGGSKASRAHGRPTPANNHDGVQELEASESTPPQASEEWDSGWDVEPTPAGKAGTDPLLARFGGAAVVLMLLVPLAMAFRSNSESALIETASASSSIAIAAGDDSGVPATDPAATAPSSTSAAPVAQQPIETATPETAPSTAESDSESDATAVVTSTVVIPNSSASALTESAESVGIESAAGGAAPAERVAPICPIEYEVVIGDFWIRIADGAGVSVDDLFELNRTTERSPLYPGSVVCLPSGSRTPPPPPPPVTSPTTAVATTVVTTTAPAATTPATTAPPATTPATTVPAAPGDVEQIIRDVWPDELEERALEIAWRESNYVPTAKNYCCYGLFQMYWNVHKSWLGGIGVTQAEQLFDPVTNAQAAYALYQRAGGWGPWGF